MAAGSIPERQSSLIADEAAERWTQVATALAPIIGLRGVAALYKRSLSITGTTFPWIAGLGEAAQTEHPYTALHAALAQQDAGIAAAASAALSENFTHLLTSLIGSALTERLLRDVWSSPTSNRGDAVQDSTP